MDVDAGDIVCLTGPTVPSRSKYTSNDGSRRPKGTSLHIQKGEQETNQQATRRGKQCVEDGFVIHMRICSFAAADLNLGSCLSLVARDTPLICGIRVSTRTALGLTSQDA